MAKKNFNLEVELTAKIDDLTAKLNQANTRVNNLRNNTRNQGGGNDIFSGLMKSGLAFGAGMASVSTAMAAFEGVINTTQTAGDSWAVTVSGMKGGLEGFYRTIGTGDWSNLVTNMVNGAAAARNLTAALDELFEQSNASSLNNAQIDLQIAGLEQARNVAKANKDYGKVIETAQQIGNLEMQKLTNQMFVANAEKKAFFDDIKTITGLDDKAILGFIQTYNDTNVEEVRKLATAYNAEVEKIKSTKSGYMLNGQYIDTSAGDNKKALDNLKTTTKQEVQIYAATLKAYNSINDEKITNAINAEKKIYEVQTQSIKQQTANEVALAKAKNKEDDYGNKVVKPTTIPVKPIIEATGLDALKQQLQQLEKQQTSSLTIDAAIELNAPIAETKKKIEDWEKQINPKPVEIEVELKGLQLLEKDLSNLQNLQNSATTSEQYKGFEQQIQAKQQAIKDFKGEIESTNEVLKTQAEQTADFLNEIGGAFGAMSQAMSATGNEGAAKFFSMIQAITDMMGAVQALGTILQTQAAIEQSITAQKVANTGTQVAADGAVAQSGAIRAGSGLPFPFNIIAIAAGVAAVISAFASIQKFETGGIVGGSSFTGDNIIAGVNSGEMILNRGQQGNLFKMLNSSQSNKTNGEVVFKIDGSTLLGVLNNQNKKIKSYR